MNLASPHVMPGLDPGIHLGATLTVKMDGRVKPGHDGVYV
jgi:hypothetical protein